MVKQSSVIFLALFSTLAGCGSSAFQSRDLRFSPGGTKFFVRESGAIIVGKRQVGQIGKDGKIADSRGRILAWVHKATIRIRGGINLPISTDEKNSFYVPKSAQEKAGLKPVEYRIRDNATIARTRNSKGVPIKGLLSDARRRTILVILVLSENDLWDGPAKPAPKPADPGDGDDDDDGDLEF